MTRPRVRVWVRVATAYFLWPPEPLEPVFPFRISDDIPDEDFSTLVGLGRIVSVVGLGFPSGALRIHVKGLYGRPSLYEGVPEFLTPRLPANATLADRLEALESLLERK